MEKFYNNLKKIKEHYALVVSVLGIIITLFMGIHNLLNKNDEILKKLETTQQMALKSVIWNDAIPLTERASACDVYTNAGYNSMTKKECQVIVDKGAEQGIFSYAREED